LRFPYEIGIKHLTCGVNGFIGGAMEDFASKKRAKVDRKEFELPETVYIRDVENNVFQTIVLKCLEQIEGVSLVEGNFINHLLGRGAMEGTRNIYIEQDSRSSSVAVKLEVNCTYGVSIPEKAEEIQFKIAREITKWTGLHVSAVHVVFKDILDKETIQHFKQTLLDQQKGKDSTLIAARANEDGYTDEF
jgi:uncharacterized alkaline shock family protein YloU